MNKALAWFCDGNQLGSLLLLFFPHGIMLFYAPPFGLHQTCYDKHLCPRPFTHIYPIEIKTTHESHFNPIEIHFISFLVNDFFQPNAHYFLDMVHDWNAIMKQMSQ